MRRTLNGEVVEQGRSRNTTLSAPATQGPEDSQDWAGKIPLRLELLHDLQKFIVYLFVILELDLDVPQVG